MTCASALPGKMGKHKNRIFSLKRCVSALLEFNQSLLDFFSLFDSRLILMLLYDSLNRVINAFSSGLLGGMVQEKRSQESRSSWTVLHAQCMCTNVLSSWKRKCHLWCVWYRLIFVEIVRYPINTIHWLSLHAWWKTTLIFYTATDTVTDLVNVERAGNRQQDGMLPF